MPSITERRSAMDNRLILVISTELIHRTSKGSTEATTEPRENLIARDELNLSEINLRNPILDLKSPRLFDTFIRRTVEGLDE